MTFISAYEGWQYITALIKAAGGNPDDYDAQEAFGAGFIDTPDGFEYDGHEAGIWGDIVDTYKPDVPDNMQSSRLTPGDYAAARLMAARMEVERVERKLDRARQHRDELT